MSFDYFASCLLIFAYAAIVGARNSVSSAKGGIKCYSCMSGMYEGVFKNGLSSLFTQPLNFTDQCANPTYASKIKTVECKSICLNIREETEFLGVPFVGYIRGCYDQILKKGFNETIVKWYRWRQRDSCNFYNKHEILQTSNYKPAKPANLLYICTCYMELCNGSTTLLGALVLDELSAKFVLLILHFMFVWIFR